jgi:hypothetical protein
MHYEAWSNYPFNAEMTGITKKFPMPKDLPIYSIAF